MKLNYFSNDNGVRVVNFATSKNLIVKSTMFPYCNIHKFAGTSLDGKTHNQIYHILIDRKWLSSILDVQSPISFIMVACQVRAPNQLD
jgi:hypothetical protein